MFETFKWVKDKHGILALWRGSATGVALWALYMGVQFPVYRSCRRTMEDHSFFSKGAIYLCSGAVSGIVATVASYPLDWARTRLTVSEEYKHVGSFRELFASTLSQRNGFRLIYRGLTPSVLAIVPSASLHFGFYELLGALWDSRITRAEWAPTELFDWGRALVCGGLGGGMAKLMTYPLDTLKKRMQVSGAASSTITSFFVAVNSARGMRGLFRGVTPSLCKAAASSGFAFFLFEAASQTILWTNVPFLTKKN